MSKHILIPADTRYFVGDKKGQQLYGKALITNRMKAECMGEFSWEEDAPYYDENGNTIEFNAKHVVPWDLCKKIYQDMAQVAARKIISDDTKTKKPG